MPLLQEQLQEVKPYALQPIQQPLLILPLVLEEEQSLTNGKLVPQIVTQDSVISAERHQLLTMRLL